MLEAPDASRREHLTADRLAREAEVVPDYVRRLVEAGVLHPDENGLHGPGYVLQIRLVRAFAASGIELADLTWAIQEAGQPLDRIAAMWTVAAPSGRPFAEFAAALGERAILLPALYAAFGLPHPAPETPMRSDEEDASVQ